MSNGCGSNHLHHHHQHQQQLQSQQQQQHYQNGGGYHNNQQFTNNTPGHGRLQKSLSFAFQTPSMGGNEEFCNPCQCYNIRYLDRCLSR